MEEASVGSSENCRSVALQSSDPSSLTTAIIQREISHLSDRLDLKIDGVISQFKVEIEGIIRSYDTRLQSIDRATDKFEASLTRVPTQLQEAVSNVQALVGEKFDFVEQQIKLS